MDKIPVDTSAANGATAWLTLAALLLHVARYPATADGLERVSVDWWQHAECQYTTPAQAEAAAALTDADDAVVRGSVLWVGKREMTVSLRGKVADLLKARHDDDMVALAKLRQFNPPGVVSLTVDGRGVGIFRIEGTRLPAVWQRFGRVELCDALNVQLAWVAKAATA